jgi:MoxR-vWA-beta-propeller ternary system domain bpX0/MoxR-vWA-beta-propeller ternary system domain bpX1
VTPPTDSGERLSYFATPLSSPWQWTADGRVLVWYDGSTIAFREEVEGILRYLSAGGLPSFTSVVLVLAALKGKTPDGSWMLGPALLESVATEASELQELRMRTAIRIEKALDDYADVATLSHHDVPALRTAKGKAVLIEVLLETEPRICTPDEAKTLLADLSGGATEGEGWAKRSRWTPSRLLNDVETLARGWKRFDAARFELRLRTGLDELPRPAEIDELSASERARRLLLDLERDDALRSLAKLARDVMAAVYLPNRLLPRDEAPSGGYSDISNRGSLDRLLTSELAHDDLTLAVRVALNEALYVKREPPAESPEGRFSLLIDTGLRMWGTPRVYAAAVALAFVALQHRKRPVSTFRARRNRVEEIDLLTREGLVHLLESLETEIHPGAALEDFAARLAADETSEAVLITEADVLADREFRACLRSPSFDVLHLASVSRSGEFRLVTHPNLDGRALSQAVLDLNGLSTRRSSDAPKETSHDRDLPVILAVKPFPFFLPVRGRVVGVVNFPTGAGVCATADGRLLDWPDRKHGARELTSELPKGETLLIEPAPTDVLVVKSHRSSVSVTTVERESGRVSTVERDLSSNLSGALYRPRAVLLISARAIEAIDPETARTLARIDLTSTRWVRGRYFAGTKWQALGWDGASLRLEVVDFRGTDDRDVLHVFDSRAHEGPLALVKRVGVRSALGVTLARGDVAGLVGISSDGCRIAARAGDGGYLLLDLDHGSTVSAEHISRIWIRGKTDYVPTRSLRQHLAHVSRRDDGALLMRSEKGQWLELGTQDGSLVLMLSPCAPRDGVPAALLPLRGRGEANPDLRVATWEDGTRAFWDGRGLLHLKANSASLPEVSLVIGEKEVAAWSSDGAICGPSFFLPRGANRPAAEMLDRVHRLMRLTPRTHPRPRRGLNFIRES